MKIKTGDNVIVISGKDRGKTAKIVKVFPKENKVLAEGLNMRKRHRRPKQQGKKGEIINLPAPMPVSNVMLVCNKCGKAARVGYRLEGKNKFRICKRCGGDI